MRYHGRQTGGVRRDVLCGVFCMVFLAGTFSALHGQEIQAPHLTKYATDLTGTLTPDQLASLEQKLEAFDRSTSNQIVVLIVPTIGSGSLEETTLRIAEANRIGTKEHSNGALLFVALADRRVRIEVGYGLEGALPDALAGTIIRRELAPQFREGNYFAGIDAAVDAMMLATKDEYKPSAEKPRAGRGIGSTFLVIVLIILFAGLRLARFMNPISRRGGGFWWGGFPGGGGWGGGSFGGGSCGGGGFSGGGGSFGGGGASGSW